MRTQRIGIPEGANVGVMPRPDPVEPGELTVGTDARFGSAWVSVGRRAFLTGENSPRASALRGSVTIRGFLTVGPRVLQFESFRPSRFRLPLPAQEFKGPCTAVVHPSRWGAPECRIRAQARGRLSQSRQSPSVLPLPPVFWPIERSRALGARTLFGEA